MNKHIFVESIINKFGSPEAKKVYENDTREIKNGDNALIIKPLTEITHHLRTTFNNHTLLGSSNSRNFYAFDTNEGILLAYSPIPLWTKPALQMCFVTYYENKIELVKEFLPNKNDPQYDYDYHKEKYATVLKNIDKISLTHDDSNTFKNVMGRIESFRKSNAPIIFDKTKNKIGN